MSVYIIAEIGINHNGDPAIVEELMYAAAIAGANCVKFQKRTGVDCVPPEQLDEMRHTPWGEMTYADYRAKLELDYEAYQQIDLFATTLGIDWTASVWDLGALKFLQDFSVTQIKIPSAQLTNELLIEEAADSELQIILSTGMSTMDQISIAAERIPIEQLTLLHCVSTYPSEPSEINLLAMQRLKYEFPLARVGYSGHERGTQATIAAVALGAEVIERHITLDRTMWGTDQAASLEPHAFEKMVRDIRIVEEALGDGEKKVVERELPILEKLRYPFK